MDEVRHDAAEYDQYVDPVRHCLSPNYCIYGFRITRGVRIELRRVGLAGHLLSATATRFRMNRRFIDMQRFPVVFQVGSYAASSDIGNHMLLTQACQAPSSRPFIVSPRRTRRARRDFPLKPSLRGVRGSGRRSNLGPLSRWARGRVRANGRFTNRPYDLLLGQILDPAFGKFGVHRSENPVK
jgi:hypothetical protein